MKARHLFGPAMLAASTLALACAPPPPPVTPQLGTSVRYVPITATFTVADCQNNPGGFPEWQTLPDGSRVLVCRIVP